MSIPIPLILALMAQKNSKSVPHMQADEQKSKELVPVTANQRPQINRMQHTQNMAAKLNGVAQLVGGSRGAQIGNVARVMGSVNSMNNPINILSLLAKSRMPSVNNMVSNPSIPNIKGASNIYDNINKMLSNMDKDKKEELLSMAKSIMNTNK